MIKFLQLANEASKHLKPPGCIPPSIIASSAKRLTEPGFRWAPESFLGLERSYHAGPFAIPDQDNSGQMMLRQSGTLCRDGLRIMYPGIEITDIREDQPLEANFLIDTKADEGRKSYMPAIWSVSYSKSEFEPSWKDTDESTGIAPRQKDSGKLAIIICEYLDFEKRGQSCVLVRIKSRDGGALIVERLCAMAGARTPKYDDQEWIKAPWKRVQGKWLPTNQIWCVD
jgi:hypothetical protein